MIQFLQESAFSLAAQSWWVWKSPRNFEPQLSLQTLKLSCSCLPFSFILVGQKVEQLAEVTYRGSWCTEPWNPNASVSVALYGHPRASLSSSKEAGYWAYMFSHLETPDGQVSMRCFSKP